MQPPDFAAFPKPISHTRASSPGPDGILYLVWVAIGESGYRVLYQTLLRGFLLPPTSTAVSSSSQGGRLLYSRHLICERGSVRPITPSITCHKPLAEATNATLEQAAELIVHPAQRGFMPGLGRLTNVFEALAPVHIASLVEGRRFRHSPGVS